MRHGWVFKKSKQCARGSLTLTASPQWCVASLGMPVCCRYTIEVWGADTTCLGLSRYATSLLSFFSSCKMELGISCYRMLAINSYDCLWSPQPCRLICISFRKLCHTPRACFRTKHFTGNLRWIECCLIRLSRSVDCIKLRDKSSIVLQRGHVNKYSSYFSWRFSN